MAKNNTIDMTLGSPWKVIITFAIPVFLSGLFQQLYNSVDSLIVGNFLGKQALAAVSSSGNLIFLFTSFFTGTAMGAGVLIANYFGQKHYDDMSKAIHTDVALGLISSVVLTILGVFLTPYILRLMGTAEDVLPQSIIYFRNYFFGITGVIMYNIFTGILQSIGDSKRPLYYLIVSSILNICLDLLFVGYFKFGVDSAAIATAISQFLSAFLCFTYLIRKGTVYQLKIKEIKIHKNMLGKIIKYGVPSGIQNSVIGLANVFVQANINSFGSSAMAGCGSYAKINGFTFLPITSFTLALSTYISQNLGAKEYERAKKGARFGIITSVLLAESIGVITFFFGKIFISLFSSEPDVVQIGALECTISGLFYCLLAYSHCVASVCKGAGKPVVPMLVMLIDWCFIRVLFITIMMKFDHNIIYLFWAYPLTWGISSVFFYFYFHFSNWQHGLDKNNITSKDIKDIEDVITVD